MNDVQIDETWKNQLKGEFSKKYWIELTDRVHSDYTAQSMYPKPKDIFRAFSLCKFDEVNVVIIGQDPYHGYNQANGLCFSVNDGVTIPPSLRNIYKEIKNDLNITPLDSGDLSRWARQGVLLLNSVLTVLANKPLSHANIGWETFTDEIIHILNSRRKNIVYMLWGKYAQEKGKVIDKENNLVLTSAHPSPYSSYLFFNNHHFSKCNEYLEAHSIKPINWI